MVQHFPHPQLPFKTRVHILQIFRLLANLRSQAIASGVSASSYDRYTQNLNQIIRS
jgi:hypothetical protein